MAILGRRTSAHYLGNKSTYDMIHGRDWCGLDKLLREDFSGNWWGGFECEFNENFSNQSEILPLHISFSESTNPYDSAIGGGTGSVNVLELFVRNGDRLFSETFNGEIPYDYTVTDNVSTSEEHGDGKHIYRTLTNISIVLDRPLASSRQRPILRIRR